MPPKLVTVEVFKMNKSYNCKIISSTKKTSKQILPGRGDFPGGQFSWEQFSWETVFQRVIVSEAFFGTPGMTYETSLNYALLLYLKTCARNVFLFGLICQKSYYWKIFLKATCKSSLDMRHSISLTFKKKKYGM